MQDYPLAGVQCYRNQKFSCCCWGEKKESPPACIYWVLELSICWWMGNAESLNIIAVNQN